MLKTVLPYAWIVALVAGCAAPQTEPVATPRPTVRAARPAPSLAAIVPPLLAAHRHGRAVTLRKADAQRVIRAYIDGSTMLEYASYRVTCPGDLNLSGPRHGTCKVSAGDRSAPYDLWIEDSDAQLRVGGHGFLIETARVRNAIAAAIQRAMPRTDISPYDVNCGDDDVIIIYPGTQIPCVFSADAVIVPFTARFSGVRGHLEVEQRKKP